jgi:dipeptidyl-peptidase-4
MGVNEQQATLSTHASHSRTRRWQDQQVSTPTAASSFPRRQAATRGFRLGAPRSFTISPDGRRVVFLRSPAGDNPSTALWTLDATTGEERCVLDPSTIDVDAEHLSDFERSRRERVRETAGGVVTYSADDAVERAVATLGSTHLLVDLRSGRIEVLDLQGEAIDVRLDPTGRRVAFVRDGGVWTHDLTGMASTGPVRLTPVESSDTVTWGLAEFVAAEEMGRTRGYWWSPEGGALLVARVDVAPVPTWWIADPATPSAAPTEQRYPAAGAANADVSLHRVRLTGDVDEVRWDRERFEYLTTADWDGDGPWLQVQSRDQRTLAVLAIAADASTTVVYELHDPTWVELVPGVPQRHRGRLVHVIDDATCDTRRLTFDGAPVSPPGYHLRSVDTVGEAGVLVTATTADSRDLHQVTLLIDWEGNARTIGAADAWTAGRHAAGTTLLSVQDLTTLGAAVTVESEHGTWPIASFAETPSVSPAPTFIEVDGSPMRVAVLLPHDHDGRTPLPVLMDPYGGPHGQRVVAAAGAFATAQWWADQGFAVIVADGRGTPGAPSWEKAVHGDLASGVLADQVEALDAAAAALPGRLDLERVAIRGWSFGGYLAALAVLDRPDRFHAGVAGAPVSEWRLYDTHYTERYLGRPGFDGTTTDADATYEANSLLSRGDRLTRPLMLIHGLADDNVVAAHTLQLSTALLAAGRPHEVLPLSGVTHMTPQEIVAENLLLLQRDFVKRSLAPAAG